MKMLLLINLNVVIFLNLNDQLDSLASMYGVSVSF